MPPSAIVTRVLRVAPETARAATIAFDLRGARFGYRSGQAVNIDPAQFPGLGGLGAPRSYSLISSPAADPGVLEITVKRGAGLSTFLCDRLRPGDEVRLFGPAGNFTLPDPPDPSVEGFLHVAAGVGVAPCRGMIRHALALGLPPRNALVLQNRTPEDVLYRAEWDALERQGRLKVFRVFSPRRVDEETLRAGIGAAPSGWMAFVCGPNARPPGFVDAVAGDYRRGRPGLLGRVGIPFEKIRTEIW